MASPGHTRLCLSLRKGLAACLAAALALAASLAGTASASSTSLSATGASAAVFGGSPVTMSFPLERSGDSSYDTWVQYRTEDGTAVAGSDYEEARGSLLVPAGTTEASIPVQVLGAAASSPDKQFTLGLGVAGVGPAPSFAAQEDFAAGEGANAVVSADLNGDGKPDLSVANRGDGTASVLLNITAPGATTFSFEAQQTFATGSAPSAIAAADLNGDGRPDLLTANQDDDTVSALLNTTVPGAAPSFEAQQTFATGSAPSAIAAADVNGDGRPDLITANEEDGTASVLLNATAPGATTPSFEAQQTFAAGQGSDSVEAADVNGDGRPDLIVANRGDGTASVLLNATAPGATTPSFAAQQSFAVGGASPSSVATADVNGDGRPDLVAAINGAPGVAVLLNTTAPGASTPSFAPPQPFSLQPSDQGQSVAAADLNGDGRPDLLVASSSGGVSALLNTTPSGAETPSFSAPQGFGDSIGKPWWVAADDLNGDGRADLIVADNSTDGQVAVLPNTTAAPSAGPSMTSEQSFPTSENPASTAAADLNGDGSPDLLTANQGDDTVSALRNMTVRGASAPSFAIQQDFTSGEEPSGVFSTDLNGDGRPDLLVANRGDDTASVLLNTTAPGVTAFSFATHESFDVGDAPSAIAATDLNGDGRPDLLVANGGDDTASVLLNTTVPGSSTPSFATEQSFVVGDAPSAIAAADLNGDGRPDLLTANQDEDTVSALLNTTATGASTAAFAAQESIAVGDDPTSITAADVDGDGRPDPLVSSKAGDTIEVLLNTTSPGASTPSLSVQGPFITAEAPTAVAAADVNGDGRPDLLSANDDNTVSALLNGTTPGSPTLLFDSAITFMTGESPTSLAVADLNGDGGPDLVTADANDNVSVLLDGQYLASISPASVTGTIDYQAPGLSIAPSSLAFGEQLLGSSTSETVTLSSTGERDLSLAGIAIGGPDADRFGQTSSCPSTLAVGSECSIAVSFAPSAAGAASATLVVTSDAPSSPDTLALSGAGYAASPPAAHSTKRRPQRARLRIRRVQPRAARAKLRVAVAGTIAKPARGAVRVKVSVKRHGRQVAVTGRARIHKGRWHLRLALPGVTRDSGAPLSVTARFAGSPGVRAGHAKRRIPLRRQAAGHPG